MSPVVQDFFKGFREVWLIDTEFALGPGKRPMPHTLVAIEWRTGRELRLGQSDLTLLSAPPFELGTEACFIAYAAAAEWSAFQALGWCLPRNVIDPFYLWIMRWNGAFRGSQRPSKDDRWRSLLSACKHYGISTMDSTDKDSMRELALRGGIYTPEEQRRLVDYCSEDTALLAPLTAHLVEEQFFSLDTALQLGRYSKTVAAMEFARQPVDTSLLQQLIAHRAVIREELIRKFDQFGVFVDGQFNLKQFGELVAHLGIQWPRTPTGRLSTREEVFEDIGGFQPTIKHLGLLRKTINLFKETSKEKPLDFSIPGTLGYRVWPLGTKTGRNTPSSSEFVFTMPKWMRGILKPLPGQAVAYLDYTAQEIGVAAALSKDPNLIEAYESDVYLHFAKLTKAAPPCATKATHKPIRDAYKPIVLGINYGAGAQRIGATANITLKGGQNILRIHRESYPLFWEYIDRTIRAAYDRGAIWTPLGWRMVVRADTKRTTLQNWTIQATSADICRTAACLAVEAGVIVDFSVHDALCISAPIADIDCAISTTLGCMERASMWVLGGFKLRAEVDQVIRFPDRYRHKEGSEEGRMWQTAMSILQKVQASKGGMPNGNDPVPFGTPVSSYFE
jgi:DNA polymerase I